MYLDFFENKYFIAIMSIIIVLYAFNINLNLPPFLIKLFQNTLFRIVILFLIFVRGYKDPQFSLLMAASFVIITDGVRQHVLKKSFEQTK